MQKLRDAIGVVGGIAIIIALIVCYLPIKYLPLPVDTKDVNAVSIPGATEIDFYDVQGWNENILQNKMLVEQKTLGGVGITNWNIKVVYVMTNPNTPDCKIVSARATYTIKVTLPRWTDPRDGPVFMIWEWRNFLERVVVHEAHHVQIVIDNVNMVEQAVSTSNCENEEENFNAALDKVKQLQDDFDTEQKKVGQTPINLQ